MRHLVLLVLQQNFLVDIGFFAALFCVETRFNKSIFTCCYGFALFGKPCFFVRNVCPIRRARLLYNYFKEDRCLNVVVLKVSVVYIIDANDDI